MHVLHACCILALSDVSLHSTNLCELYAHLRDPTYLFLHTKHLGVRQA